MAARTNNVAKPVANTSLMPTGKSARIHDWKVAQRKKARLARDLKRALREQRGPVEEVPF